MRDKVFIAWSGTNDDALAVKEILEEDYNYICYIGGNSDNDSDYSSVGDTVIQQIKECNQAIVIFQNREDGQVSNNVFFELGFVFAMYGTKKVHCVKHASENIVLPSDFDNSFVEPISEDASTSFAKSVVNYFIKRQKLSVNDNKMFLINNRYLIHDKIKSHYSETGSKCSDYELAQYLLFYLQAAQMFGDERKILNEITEFKRLHHFEFSSELSLSVNMSISFLEMLISIKADEVSSETYLEKTDFWKYLKDYENYSRLIVYDEFSAFDEWISVFLYEHITYAYMLFFNNKSLDEKNKITVLKKALDYAFKTIDAIVKVEQETPCKENNDETGIISLLKAYVFRNLFLAKQYLKDEDAGIWLEKTFRERESLKNHFDKGSVDTQLYNTFRMEYYLSVINYVTFKKDISEFELMMYKDEIKDYLESVKKDRHENAYLKQIALWCMQ